MGRPEVDRLIDEVGLPEAGSRRRVASILFTYRCSIRCKHCLFGAAPDRPDVVMTARQCADGLRLLHETGRVIHIAGGEPMLYWDTLAESVRIAHAEGNAPHFIETNCSFAADDDIVRERLELLARNGVKGLLASADAFHQEFVRPERFLRVRRIAREVFGERNFWGPGETDAEITNLESVARDEARLREYVRGRPTSMVGTARRELARFLDARDPGDAELPSWSWQGPRDGPGCARQFRADTMWEIHVDPYGNIQTNCGTILGNLARTTPAELLAAGPERANRFVEAVCEGGAQALAELARRERGFEPPARVTQTCELCYIARAFLRRFHPDVFGPEEVYA